MNKYNNLLSKIKVLVKEYPSIEITNIDAKGNIQNRAVYFYEKGKERYRNVFFELWYSEPQDKYTFLLFRSLLTPSEDKEASGNKKYNSNRGELYRYNLDIEELLDYTRNKLNLYCEISLQ